MSEEDSENLVVPMSSSRSKESVSFSNTLSSNAVNFSNDKMEGSTRSEIESISSQFDSIFPHASMYSSAAGSTEAHSHSAAVAEALQTMDVELSVSTLSSITDFIGTAAAHERKVIDESDRQQGITSFSRLMSIFNSSEEPVSHKIIGKSLEELSFDPKVSHYSVLDPQLSCPDFLFFCNRSIRAVTQAAAEFIDATNPKLFGGGRSTGGLQFTSNDDRHLDVALVFPNLLSSFASSQNTVAFISDYEQNGNCAFTNLLSSVGVKLESVDILPTADEMVMSSRSLSGLTKCASLLFTSLIHFLLRLADPIIPMDHYSLVITLGSLPDDSHESTPPGSLPRRSKLLTNLRALFVMLPVSHKNALLELLPLLSWVAGVSVSTSSSRDVMYSSDRCKTRARAMATRIAAALLRPVGDTNVSNFHTFTTSSTSSVLSSSSNGSPSEILDSSAGGARIPWSLFPESDKLAAVNVVEILLLHWGYLLHDSLVDARALQKRLLGKIQRLKLTGALPSLSCLKSSVIPLLEEIWARSSPVLVAISTGKKIPAILPLLSPSCLPLQFRRASSAFGGSSSFTTNILQRTEGDYSSVPSFSVADVPMFEKDCRQWKALGFVSYDPITDCSKSKAGLLGLAALAYGWTRWGAFSAAILAHVHGLSIDNRSCVPNNSSLSNSEASVSSDSNFNSNSTESENIVEYAGSVLNDYEICFSDLWVADALRSPLVDMQRASRAFSAGSPIHKQSEVNIGYPHAMSVFAVTYALLRHLRLDTSSLSTAGVGSPPVVSGNRNSIRLDNISELFHRPYSVVPVATSNPDFWSIADFDHDFSRAGFTLKHGGTSDQSDQEILSASASLEGNGKSSTSIHSSSTVLELISQSSGVFLDLCVLASIILHYRWKYSLLGSWSPYTLTTDVDKSSMSKMSGGKYIPSFLLTPSPVSITASSLPDLVIRSTEDTLSLLPWLKSHPLPHQSSSPLPASQVPSPMPLTGLNIYGAFLAWKASVCAVDVGSIKLKLLQGVSHTDLSSRSPPQPSSRTPSQFNALPPSSSVGQQTSRSRAPTNTLQDILQGIVTGSSSSDISNECTPSVTSSGPLNANQSTLPTLSSDSSGPISFVRGLFSRSRAPSEVDQDALPSSVDANTSSIVNPPNGASPLVVAKSQTSLRSRAASLIGLGGSPSVISTPSTPSLSAMGSLPQVAEFQLDSISSDVLSSKSAVANEKSPRLIFVNPSDRSRLLSTSMLQTLAEAPYFLPDASIGPTREWVLLYSLTRDGASISRMLDNVEGAGSSLLVVKDDCGAIFGCLVGSPWRREPSIGHSALGDCAVFTFQDRAVFDIVRANLRDQPIETSTRVPVDCTDFEGKQIPCHVYTACGTRIFHSVLVHGGNPVGISVGGGGNAAIYLDADFDRGTSGPSSTFLSPSLADFRNFEEGEFAALEQANKAKDLPYGEVSVSHLGPEVRFRAIDVEVWSWRRKID